MDLAEMKWRTAMMVSELRRKGRPTLKGQDQAWLAAMRQSWRFERLHAGGEDPLR
jgi:hypothetical protein